MSEKRSSYRRSIYVWPLLVWLIGVSLTLFLADIVQQRAMDLWRERAGQETTQLSTTLLSWIEESYATLSGLGALVENSDAVDGYEFLNAVEGMESRAKVNFMQTKALLEYRDDGWQVLFSSASTDADPA
ncbi:MAG: hypothetical protein HQL49_07560 [Gammaproteobacteria bacterium]|nr:hypothetical protein [Gammaproteobacteria bacterium]